MKKSKSSSTSLKRKAAQATAAPTVKKSKSRGKRGSYKESFLDDLGLSITSRVGSGALAEVAKQSASRTEEEATSPALHSGLMALARCWYCLGVRRRSAFLLSKSMSLVSKIGSTMDEVLMLNSSDQGDTHMTQRMTNVSNLWQTPLHEQNPCLPRIVRRDLPTQVLAVCSERGDGSGQPLDDRWVLIRHDLDGQVGWFTSRAFDRDICSFKVIQETFRANKRSVLSLFCGVVPAVHAESVAMLISQYDIISGLPTRPSYYRCKLMKKDSGRISAGEKCNGNAAAATNSGTAGGCEGGCDASVMSHAFLEDACSLYVVFEFKERFSHLTRSLSPLHRSRVVGATISRSSGGMMAMVAAPPPPPPLSSSFSSSASSSSSSSSSSIPPQVPQLQGAAAIEQFLDSPTQTMSEDGADHLGDWVLDQDPTFFHDQDQAVDQAVVETAFALLDSPKPGGGPLYFDGFGEYMLGDTL